MSGDASVIRGLFSGVFWGLAACVVVVGTVLMLSPLAEPLLPEPEVVAEAPPAARAAPPDATAGATPPPVAEDAQPEGGGNPPSTVEEAEPVGAPVVAALPSSDPTVPEAGSDAAQRPGGAPSILPEVASETPPAAAVARSAPRADVAATAGAAPVAPDGVSEDVLAGRSVPGQAPLRGSAPTRTPPSADSRVTVETRPPVEPRQPAPKVMAELAAVTASESAPGGGAVPVLPERSGVEPAVPKLPELDAPAITAEAPATSVAPPALPQETEAPATAAGPGPVVATAPSAPPLPEVDGAGAGQRAEEIARNQPGPEGGDAPAPTAEADPQPAPEPQPETEIAQDDGQATRPGILRIGQAGTGIRTSRLPQIGGAEAEVLDGAVSAEPAPTGQGALARHRMPFGNPDGLPVIAVVLMVGRDAGVDAQMLDSLPFPVTLAFDMAVPGQGDLAHTARSAGREVMIIPDLPAGAGPSDVEVALAAHLEALPEAVALMSGPGAEGFQANRSAVAQVVAAAGATGHGLVTFPRGFNTAQQLALRDGVPSALVFRELDGAGEDSAAIGRVLDQAAFRARQEGAVILAGRARPETVTALTEWALGNRAASVALAPVSAVLLAQTGS